MRWIQMSVLTHLWCLRPESKVIKLQHISSLTGRSTFYDSLLFSRERRQSCEPFLTPSCIHLPVSQFWAWVQYQQTCPFIPCSYQTGVCWLECNWTRGRLYWFSCTAWGVSWPTLRGVTGGLRSQHSTDKWRRITGNGLQWKRNRVIYHLCMTQINWTHCKL